LNLAAKRIAIVTHVEKTGSAHELLTYLLEHGAESVLFIGHPLSYVPGRPGPELRLYEGSRLVGEERLTNRNLPGLVQYARDIFLTLYWVLRTRGRWDLIICADNLNAAAGLLLRFLHKVRTVVYYTIDYTPQRFSNRVLNDAYHRLDAICLAGADVTWNVSDRIAEGRETIRGLKRSAYDRQVTVPIGIWIERQTRRGFDQIERHSLIYSGGLLPHQGVRLVLEAMPSIVAKVPDAILRIAGMGPLEAELKALTAALDMEQHVQFLGYVENSEDLESLVAGSGVAAAMYSQEMDRWSYYADPSKVKLYLGAGVPIVTTSLTHIAKELERRRCGLVIPYDREAFAEAVVMIFLDRTRHSQFRENAARYAREFDWNVIFARALEDKRLRLGP
jgi:glycosyltransferase involved in cell wall biosynthesis